MQTSPERRAPQDINDWRRGSLSERGSRHNEKFPAVPSCRRWVRQQKTGGGASQAAAHFGCPRSTSPLFGLEALTPSLQQPNLKLLHFGGRIGFDGSSCA